MEEKLYFRPVINYKDTKKHKENPKKEDEKNHTLLKLCIFLFLLIAIILIVLWLLRGKTTVSGEFPENVKNESLSCASREIIPEKFSSAASDDKSLKVNAIFHGEDTLKNISLIYEATFASESLAYGAEAKTHAEFNRALGLSHYDSQKFSNKFARYDNRLIISLYATEAEIDEMSAGYFLITRDSEGKVSLKSIEDYQKNYENLGFVCESSVK